MHRLWCHQSRLWYHQSRLWCHQSFTSTVRLYSGAELAALKSECERIVGPIYVHDPLDSDTSKYTNDWTKSYSGGDLVVKPKGTEEVSKVLTYCHKHRISVVPQGGNTGLVGGGVGKFTSGTLQLIVSLERMNRILCIDAMAATVTCESGVVLEALNNEVEKYDLIVPLDLGAKGSCMIGGNVATNAGGLRVVKYGSMHSNVLGLEVVLADGTVLDMLRTIHKDNTGYPLKHLFIGSEGTLGIITKVALSLATKPSYTSIILAKVASFAHVQQLLTYTRR